MKAILSKSPKNAVVMVEVDDQGLINVDVKSYTHPIPENDQGYVKRTETEITEFLDLHGDLPLPAKGVSFNGSKVITPLSETGVKTLGELCRYYGYHDSQQPTPV